MAFQGVLRKNTDKISSFPCFPSSLSIIFVIAQSPEFISLLYSVLTVSWNDKSKVILQVLPCGPKDDSLWHNKVHCLTKEHTLSLWSRGDASPRWAKAIFYLYYMELESSAHTLHSKIQLLCTSSNQQPVTWWYENSSRIYDLAKLAANIN